MKKSLFILALAIILTVFCTSCKKNLDDDTLPDGMTLIESKTGDFNFFYPDEWIVDRNDAMIMVHASKEDASGVSVTAFAHPRDGMESLEEYLKTTYVSHIKESVAGVEIDENAFKKSTLSGRDARRIEFVAKSGGKDYRFLQVITENSDGYIYIITYTSSDSNFKTHLDDVERIISEFKFN